MAEDYDEGDEGGDEDCPVIAIKFGGLLYVERYLPMHVRTSDDLT